MVGSTLVRSDCARLLSLPPAVSDSGDEVSRLSKASSRTRLSLQCDDEGLHISISQGRTGLLLETSHLKYTLTGLPH